MELKAGVSETVSNKAAVRAAALSIEIEGLRQLRQAMEKTQVTLAQQMNLSQASVAKMEQRTDILLSTLRDYVRALGGELSLIARFPGQPEMRIAGLGDISTRSDLPTSRQSRQAGKKHRLAEPV